jgi:hypothetical protein
MGTLRDLILSAAKFLECDAIRSSMTHDERGQTASDEQVKMFLCCRLLKFHPASHRRRLRTFLLEELLIYWTVCINELGDEHHQPFPLTDSAAVFLLYF